MKQVYCASMSKRSSKCLTVDFRRDSENWEYVEACLEELRQKGCNQGWILRTAIVQYLARHPYIKATIKR